MAKGKVYATRDLIREQKAGKTIVCNVREFAGYEVKHDARRTGDPFPWVVPGGGGRYRGTECTVANTGLMI